MLQECIPGIRHIKGKENIIADALSRVYIWLLLYLMSGSVPCCTSVSIQFYYFCITVVHMAKESLISEIFLFLEEGKCYEYDV